MDTITTFTSLGISTEGLLQDDTPASPVVAETTPEELNDIYQCITALDVNHPDRERLLDAASTLHVIRNRLMDNLSPGLSYKEAVEIQDEIKTKIHEVLKVNPLPHPETFEQNPQIATRVAVESFENIVTRSAEMIIGALLKLWKMITDLIKHAIGVMGRLGSRYSANRKAILSLDNQSSTVEDKPENYFTITKEIQVLYRPELKAFTQDVLGDLQRLNEILNKVYIPYLKTEIEVAEKLIEYYAPSAIAAINNDEETLERLYSQIDAVYADQRKKMMGIVNPHQGEYLGGLTLVNEADDYRIFINMVKTRESSVSFLAVNQTKLDIINSLSGSMLDLSNKELNALYAKYEAASQKGVNAITKAVDTYRKNNSFSKSKGRRIDGLMAKHFAHFNKTSSVISSVINTFIRAAYVINTEFVPKNLAILNNQ